MTSLLFTLILLALPTLTMAQGFGGGGFGRSGTADRLLEVTVAGLGAPAAGAVRIVTDGSDSSDCTSGGGSTRVLCSYDGAAWTTIGGGGSTPTLDQAFDQGKVIDGANSVANAFRVSDGTTPMCHYTDATLGPVVLPCTAANTRTIAMTNFTWCLYDQEGASCALTFDPDAASPNAMYTWASGYRPLKSIYWPAGALSSDGTQCADPAEVTLNSGPKQYTIICADNDSSRMHGMVVMPDSWDAGTVTFEVQYVQTAADTSALHLDVAAACRGATETVNGTYGTEVAIDDAAVTGSNAVDSTTSGAVTPNGTCAAGDLLYWYLDVDATGTTTAMGTVHFLGVKMAYTTDSLSD